MQLRWAPSKAPHQLETVDADGNPNGQYRIVMSKFHREFGYLYSGKRQLWFGGLDEVKKMAQYILENGGPDKPAP